MLALTHLPENEDLGLLDDALDLSGLVPNQTLPELRQGAPLGSPRDLWMHPRGDLKRKK